MRRSISCFALLLAVLCPGASAQTQITPTIDQLISLQRVGSPAMSPNGA